MRRIVLVLVSICALQVGAAPAARGQDPSGVSGYIVITDPATGERWLPKDDAGNVLGYVSVVTVVFRSRTGPGEARVPIENFGASATFANHVKYEIAFNYSYISRTSPPTLLGRSAGSTGPRQIQYNPDVWQYDRIEMGSWRVVGGTRGVDLTIPLTQRASPFPDLR